ncbi:hypothetical protein FZZ93_18080 [Halomonas eurihalina]|uniref:Uncharacterized protein n=1 Tax=Halomonas eurihalina TaxID=42566 RepID=A0A5D9CKZ4_HALER|nr:hypothetical protein FZZ93_18080 [Halomonas eurihalina]
MVASDGQAAFPFLLTPAIAPLRLSHGRTGHHSSDKETS